MKKTDSAKTFLLLAAIAAICGCSSAQGRPYAMANPVPALTENYSVEIFIESEQAFAAYTIELEYNPAIVKVFSVEPGDFGGKTSGSSLSSYSSSSTMSNPSTYASGKTSIMAFSTLKEAGPGMVKVAIVEFEPASGQGASPINAKLVNLYDISGKPVEGTVSLSKNELKFKE
ncbi:MAG: hypothetical protein HZA48_10750 [Planctomycetes bacterium]|nr:hypothetical protein [Planctomycetota bacterium]